MSKLEEYNKIPLHFCTHCLSLNIKILEGENDYCDQCGDTSISSNTVEHWEELYELKYKKKFNNGRKV